MLTSFDSPTFCLWRGVPNRPEVPDDVRRKVLFESHRCEVAGCTTRSRT